MRKLSPRGTMAAACLSFVALECVTIKGALIWTRQPSHATIYYKHIIAIQIVRYNSQPIFDVLILL